MLEDYAYGNSFHELLHYAPWYVLFLCIAAFAIDLFFSKPDAHDPYDPAPGTKWLWQSNPELRSNEEPPPNDLMKEELALHEAGEGPWPSWYIGWNYTFSDWDWGRGWRRHGLPADSRRGPASLGDRWFWQDDPAHSLPSDPPPTQAMQDEAARHRTGAAPWPSYFLTPEFEGAADEAPSRDNLVWGRAWRKEEMPDIEISGWRAPPAHRDTPTDAATAWTVVCSFLVVYALIMLADWIQGPYVYAIYKEMGISEDSIMMLFGANTLSSILFGRFTGLLTDRFGRKSACQMFCVAYLFNCCSMVLPSCLGLMSMNYMPLLLAGRFFRGIATNILYSAFDSWFISQYEYLKLKRLGYNIGRIFGYLTVIKGVAAFLAGLISERVEEFTGYKEYTMVISGALFGVAWLIISFSWDENFGISTSFGNLLNAWLKPNLGPLYIVNMVFNVALDVFTLLWARTLQDISPKALLLPYPIIYSTFLACTVLGALLSNILISSGRILPYNTALTVVFLAGAACLAVPYFARFNLELVFAGLCIFRIFMGMISPILAYLMYTIVPNSSRAQIYTLFHLPFFQWSHWVNFVLIFFFGPHPDDVAETVLLALAIGMVVAGLYWYFVSNGIDILPQVSPSQEAGVAAPATTPLDIKGKLIRLYDLFGYWVLYSLEVLGSLMNNIVALFPKLGRVLVVAISSTYLTVVYAVKWVIEKTKHIWRWLFHGGRFPRLAMGTPPPSPFAAGPAAVPDPGGDGALEEFKKFWGALGILGQAFVFWMTVSTILFTATLLIFLVSDGVFGSNLQDSLDRVSVKLVEWIKYIWEAANDWVIVAFVNSYYFISDGLRNYWYSTLDVFTTCTLMFFTAADWLIKSILSIWERTETLGVLVFFLCQQAIEGTFKTVLLILGRLFPRVAYLEEINDAIENATIVIGGAVSDAQHDLIDSVVDHSKDTLENLTGAAENLIPDSVNQTFFNISTAVSEIYTAGRDFLLKRPGYEDILGSHFVSFLFVIAIGALGGYLFPTGPFFRMLGLNYSTIMKFGRYLFGFLVASCWWLIWSNIAPLISLFNLVRWLATYIQYLWMSRVAPAYDAGPASMRVVLDPGKYFWLWLWRMIKKIVGKIMYFTGSTMTSFGAWTRHCMRSCLKAIETVAKLSSDFLVRWWAGLQALGPKICEVWLTVANWLMRAGQELSQDPAPLP